MKRLILLLLAVGLMSSCVPKKRLTYLQQSEKSTPELYRLQRSKYQVQPNDILSVTVRTFDEKTAELFNAGNNGTLNASAGDLIFYLNGFTVDYEGNIEMPVVGKVHVLGKNTDEVKEIIELQLRQYFKEDAAFVSVQLAGVRFSIVGDVARPGKYVIYQNQVNIFEALAQAGDVTLVGDRKEIQIVRQTPEGVKIFEVDLTDADIISSPQYFIQPNDIINVKPLSQKSLGIGTTGFQTFASILGVVASAATLIFTLSNIN
jgi:polysaccharide export outer membrane protein